MLTPVLLTFLILLQSSVAKLNSIKLNETKTGKAEGYGGGAPPPPQSPNFFNTGFLTPNDKFICNENSHIFVKTNTYGYGKTYGYGGYGNENDPNNNSVGRHLKCSNIANTNEEACTKCCQISASLFESNSVVGIIINEQLSKQCLCCVPRNLEYSPPLPLPCSEGCQPCTGYGCSSPPPCNGGGYGC